VQSASNGKSPALEVDAPMLHCPHCGYNLTGLQNGTADIQRHFPRRVFDDPLQARNVAVFSLPRSRLTW